MGRDKGGEKSGDNRGSGDGSEVRRHMAKSERYAEWQRGLMTRARSVRSCSRGPHDTAEVAARPIGRGPTDERPDGGDQPTLEGEPERQQHGRKNGTSGKGQMEHSTRRDLSKPGKRPQQRRDNNSDNNDDGPWLEESEEAMGGSKRSGSGNRTGSGIYAETLHLARGVRTRQTTSHLNDYTAVSLPAKRRRGYPTSGLAKLAKDGSKQSRRALERAEAEEQPEPVVLPKLRLALSRKEISEDFVRITGQRPPVRPRRSSLDLWGLSLCAGLDLVTQKIY